MGLRQTHKDLIVSIICYLYILLFVYAAVSKMLDFENFQAQLGQSPLISAFAGLISYSVLIPELAIAALLAVPATRRAGMYASFCLMVMFTAYIVIILNFSANIPCSCGGVLEKMGWEEHLVFNIAFSSLAIVAILVMPPNHRDRLPSRSRAERPRALWLAALGIGCTAFMIVLYLASEQQIHYENPFQRRFIKGSAELAKQKELHTSTLYFAGTDGTTIYLGDTRAPLQIFAIDTMLSTQRQFTVKLENEDFPFKRVEIRVAGRFFYLFDGTVPVIFKGNISDWNAKLIAQQPNSYFLKAEVLESDALIFKRYLDRQRETVIGKLVFRNRIIEDSKPQLLQKQIDGLFDVDGIMEVDPITGNAVYLYYYRNQFTVSDNDLSLIYRGTTIDTNTTAKLKVSYNEKTGKRQLASPTIVVNRAAALFDNIMFVNSNVPGRHESKNMWNKAAIVDVYDLEERTYVSSFYVHNIMGSKLREMMVLNSNVFVLVGNQINSYRLGPQLINIRKQG